MGLKLRIALMGCLVAAAAYTAAEAYRSIAPKDGDIPQEVYAQFLSREEEAEYFLRPCQGYVAVYEGKRDKTPVSVTEIEISNLRGTDRALVQQGIPVGDRRELLALLEDLGS